MANTALTPHEPVRGRRATLASVATSVGVSMPTVSKVVNGRPDVAPGTRQRVERALREHGYVPPSARRPKTARQTIEMVFDRLESAYGTSVLQGVVAAAADENIDVVIGPFIATPEGAPRSTRAIAGDRWVQQIIDAGRTGVIVVTSDLTSQQVAAFDAAKVPLVVIDPLNQPRDEVTSVGATNFSGGLAACRHLIELGHRKIAFAGGPMGAPCNQARLHGYRAALEENGIAVDHELVRYGDFLYGAGYQIADEFLSRSDRPTAIFAASDSMAIGATAAARDHGLRVPEDFSVVGFDDTYLAVWCSPPLTVVRQPLHEMGQVALRTILRMAAGTGLESHHVELATTLIVRSSTGPVPPDPH